MCVNCSQPRRLIGSLTVKYTSRLCAWEDPKRRGRTQALPGEEPRDPARERLDGGDVPGDKRAGRESRERAFSVACDHDRQLGVLDCELERGIERRGDGQDGALTGDSRGTLRGVRFDVSP